MEETLINRTMPNSREAEQSVIGSMIMDKDAILTAMEMLISEDFYYKQYGILFDTMIELYSKGLPVDLVTLQNKLKEKDVPAEIASLEFVRDLLNAVPTSANVKYYAQIVKDNSMRRKLIKLNEEIENECYMGKESVETVMDITEKKVFDLLSTRGGGGDYVPIRQVVMNALEKIENAAKTSGTVTGIPTGFIDLDYRTAGLQPSDLILIAARPSMGKTAFVLSMTRNMAVNHNQPIALFSLEMSSVQLVNRLIASETELGSEKIRNGKLSEEEWQQLHSKIKALIKAPIYVDDTPALSIFELRAKCRRLQQRYGIKVLIIDYLQLMTAGADMRGNREQEVSMISRQLKIIAKELNIPVIALSQLNRGVEQRTGDAKKPMLSDLRESGAIEQDADMVLFIHRPERYGIMEDSMGNSLKGIADIIIAKHRNGAVGEIQLRFRNELAQFCDLEEVSPFASGGSTVKTVTFGSRMNEDAAPQMPQLDSDFQEGGKSFENPANSSKAPF